MCDMRMYIYTGTFIQVYDVYRHASICTCVCRYYTHMIMNYM